MAHGGKSGGTRPIVAWPCAALCALLLAACAEEPRRNVFLDPLYGAQDPPPTPGLAETDAPKPGDRAGAPATTGQRAAGPDAGRARPRTVTRGRPAPTPDPARLDRLRSALGVETAPAAPLAAGLPDTDRAVTLNFVGADIREFVDTVFGAALGVDYFLDPQVSGRVTLQTQRALGPRALIEVAREVLQANGAEIRLRDGLYIIAPGRAGDGGAGARVVRVVGLDHLDEAQTTTLIEPFVTPDLRLSRLPGGRMLLLSGPRDAVTAIEELLGVFDIDPLAGRQIALIPLANAPAGEVAGELSRLLAELGREAPGESRVIAVERINAVLVVADRPGIVSEARFWAGELDRGADAGEGGRIFVYPVRNRRAGDLAAVFTALYGDGGAAGGAGRAEALAPGIERAIVATEAAVAGDGATAAAPGGTAAGAGGTPAPAAGGTAIDFDGETVRLFPDAGTNSVVVRAPPGRLPAIETALRRLDTAPRQVLIEATIAEVTLTDALRYGVRWFFETGNFEINFGQPATAFASGISGFNVFLNGNDFRAVLSALDEVSDVEFVSTPSLMVLDNQSARLQVGDQVPVATRQSQSVTDPDAPIASSIELVDTGVILEVTPRINEGGLVSLDIRQEVSEVARTADDSGGETLTPTIQQRSFSSSVTIESGQSVLLGGLIRERRENGRSGVPLLSDIPLLGALFSTRDQRASRTELIVLLRPTVIHTPADALAVTREMRAKLRGLERLETGF